MWARIIELMLGCFLAISPFVYGYSSLWWISDLSCAIFLILFALLSYFATLEKIHLLSFLVAIYLFCIGYFLDLPFGQTQNYIVLAILLFMFVLIPSEASKPPRDWDRFIS